MERKLIDIKEEEVLSYLGIKQKDIDEQLAMQMREVKEDILCNVVPRLVYKQYDYEDGIIKQCTVPLSGHSIHELLETSSRCILVAATLGIWMDQRIRKAQLQDMGKAVLYDAYANAAIEQVMDDWQKELAQALHAKDWYITDRFSAGYGDLPLQIQPIFLQELQAQKTIGLQVGSSLLMKPEKSVTAILGISRQPQPAIVRGCSVCALKETCTKRKEGHPCGNN